MLDSLSEVALGDSPCGMLLWKGRSSAILTFLLFHFCGSWCLVRMAVATGAAAAGPLADNGKQLGIIENCNSKFFVCSSHSVYALWHFPYGHLPERCRITTTLC